MWQSYKSRTGYCTAFSLQQDVLDFCIGIPGSYRFEFQKIKNTKVQNLNFIQIRVYQEILDQKYQYHPLFGGTGQY